ncbi:TonB-dependent receptor family protein [Crenobacter cavernae]|uniref:TonB-dependent receptor n=1 Tax=Crenobacter cavernae TaxID=2290923 RepID=A0ABY0FIG4_9NEIS|nr:TonB-dependent receptor [Crenobacter cavernae]RXZ45446.1 TonB-dependent receptor [Crenobacter cavernae]
MEQNFAVSGGKRLPLLLAVLGAWQTAYADETVLPEVKVSAERISPALSLPSIAAAREELARVPGGAGLVDVDAERNGRQATLADTLGMATGVFVQPRFGAEEARLSIRGSGLQRTFHMRGVKLMQDGVPLNLADGGADFQAVEPLAARYVEVYRGANALRYGATTLGGAINYVSSHGRDASTPAFLARLEGGSFGYGRAQIAAAGASGDLDGYVSLSSFRQDGSRDHASQDAYRLFANAGWRVSANLETRFFLSDVHSNSELPGSLTRAQLQSKPRQANASSVSGDQRRDIDLTRLSNKTVWRSGEQRLELSAFYAKKKLFHPIFQVLDQANEDTGIEARWLSDAPLFGRPNRFTLGVAPTWGRTDEQRFVNVGGQRGAKTDASLQKASNVDVYAENEYGFAPGWRAIVGAQWSEARRRLDDSHVPAGQADGSFDATYHGFSPKLGLLRELDDGMQLYANWSESFEPPSLGEMSNLVINAGLKAQTAKTVEIGSRGRLEGALPVEWDASLYDARIRNELLAQMLPNNATATFNVPRTRHQGLELGFTAELAKGLSWRNAVLLNRFRFDNDPVYGDNTLAGVPKSFFKSELTQRFSAGYYVSANVEVSPQSYPVDLANTLYADRYTLVGLKVGKEVKKGLGWFAEGRNLTDEKYAATTGVILDAKGKDAAQFLPGDGRAVYAGLEWKL